MAPIRKLDSQALVQQQRNNSDDGDAYTREFRKLTCVGIGPRPCHADPIVFCSRIWAETGNENWTPLFTR